MGIECSVRATQLSYWLISRSSWKTVGNQSLLGHFSEIFGHLYTKVRVTTKKKEKEKFFSPILL